MWLFFTNTQNQPPGTERVAIITQMLTSFLPFLSRAPFAIPEMPTFPLALNNRYHAIVSTS
jgi:hypothetical protein